MRSPWDRDVSWLFNNPQEESRGLEPKIRTAISMAWIRCCEISRKYVRQQEPLQEPLEKAVVRLHHDLEQAPTLPDATPAEILVKHWTLPDDPISGSEDSFAAFFRKLEQYILDNYPNPNRIGCSPPEELKELIHHPERFDLRDERYLHLFRCAECTRDVKALRE